MGPEPDPFESDEQLPASCDVVVIGGGIIGTTTALELAERGVSVVLCEKGVIAGEQSSRNWGWCRQMGRDPREIPLAKEALRLWGGMNERVGGETGFNRCGILYLCEDDEELARQEHWRDEHARPYQLDSRIIDGDDVAERLPGGAKKWAGALFTASDGRAEPQKAAPAIAHAVRRKGGHVFTQCAVRGVETAGGRISGVVTEKGPIACTSVVLAGGAWSRRMCTSIGIRLPQLHVINSVMRTKPLDAGFGHTAAGDQFAVRKRLDGGYTLAHNHFSFVDLTPSYLKYFREFLPAAKTEWQRLYFRLGAPFLKEAWEAKTWELDEVSPFEETRILDPEPVQWVLDQVATSLKARYPAFEAMEIAQTWGGCIDVMPDIVPVISEVPSLPGFFLSTGFSGHGFGIGPGAGKLTADLVTGKPPVVDPEPYRYSRMIDGTKLAPIG